MRPFTDIPEPFRSRPFRVDEALEAGLAPHVIDGAQFWSPARGVRIPCTIADTFEVRCQALQLVSPEFSAFSHETAAVLCGLPVPRFDNKIDVIVEPDAVVPKIDGVEGHSGLVLADATKVSDLRVVHPERTFFDLAPSLTLTELVILGDAIVRRWSTPDALTDRAASMKRRRGVVKARKALPLIRPGVDSPPETRIRLMLVWAGLPCPAVNVDVFDRAGGWVARPDLSYPELKIAIEYDGDHHRTDKRQWRRDRARDQNLRDEGWLVITLTADDIFRTPDQTVARIRRAILSRSHQLR